MIDQPIMSRTDAVRPRSRNEEDDEMDRRKRVKNEYPSNVKDIVFDLINKIDFIEAQSHHYWNNDKILASRYCRYCCFRTKRDDHEQTCSFNVKNRKTGKSHLCSQCGFHTSINHSVNSDHCKMRREIFLKLAEKFPLIP